MAATVNRTPHLNLNLPRYEDQIDIEQINANFETLDGKFGPGGEINLGPNSVTSVQIAPSAVNASKLAAGAVGTYQLATGAVTSTNIQNGAVGTNQIADGSVTSTKIQNGSVGTTQIADGAVTDAKIVSVSASKISGTLNTGPSGQIPDLSGLYLPLNGGTLNGDLELGELTTNKSIYVGGTDAGAGVGAFARLYTNNNGNLILSPSTSRVNPESDNAYTLGYSANAWQAVYAYAFTNASSIETKENIVPLSAQSESIRKARSVKYRHKKPKKISLDNIYDFNKLISDNIFSYNYIKPKTIIKHVCSQETGELNVLEIENPDYDIVDSVHIGTLLENIESHPVCEYVSSRDENGKAIGINTLPMVYIAIATAQKAREENKELEEENVKLKLALNQIAKHLEIELDTI